MFRIAFPALLALGSLQVPQPPPNAPGPITPPKLLSGSSAPAAACKGIPAGEVKVQFVVTAQGKAEDVKVLASPSDAVSTCARAMVGAYQYVPAMQDLKPVAVQIVLTINVNAGS